jgi:hypothetical protein
MKNTCKHEKTKQEGRDYGFTCSVAVYPYTAENRAAHGNICYTEKCCSCGALRSVNVNGSHMEFSPWGPTQDERERREREEAARKLAEVQRQEDSAMKAHGAEVIEVREREGFSTMVEVKIGGERKSVPLWKIKEAAAQKDDGDGVVPFYRAVLRHATAKLRDYASY